ncbi:hypothetical protein HYPSUDRAFT_209474 [Hypholoma sublateritium FD-334 SS-4]|uniref:Uncharacterized protein n=1 Tax=Hypholoma sublateritium (strain FD-334 SS-4) TaxID=945553 RepID=A0A0D2NYJ9_HYPSF|nr:hypothetical protein HYPSUDRAFT_209474 [Hypholoma sublateritium FD-334 SS-4]
MVWAAVIILAGPTEATPSADIVVTIPSLPNVLVIGPTLQPLSNLTWDGLQGVLALQIGRHVRLSATPASSSLLHSAKELPNSAQGLSLQLLNGHWCTARYVLHPLPRALSKTLIVACYGYQANADVNVACSSLTDDLVDTLAAL